VKKLTHYKDTLTGRYVTRATWARSKAHGGTRYKRSYEKYTKPTAPRLPRPKPLTFIPGEHTERLKYLNKKGKKINIEIVRVNGVLKSVSVTKIKGHKKTYTNKKDLAQFAALIRAARNQGKKRGEGELS
jgi:hypothetical protein